MSTAREMRVSNVERQAAADRLKVAMDEGRLDFHEYDHRLGLAYGSKTYADLDELFADLPMDQPAPVAVRPATPPVAVPAAAVAPRTGQDALMRGFVRLPLALKILWSIWATAMAINMTVWLLVGLGDGGAVYFWPIWLLVPGVALGGATVAVLAARAGRSERHGPDQG